MDAQKIVVLGTGGTIAGTSSQAGDSVGYAAAQLGVGQLLAAIPGLQEALHEDVLEVEQVAQIDSKDMSPEVWLALAQRCAYWLEQREVRGIVITHGTDTLEETAWWLHSVLPADRMAAVPVVLTCAMRPATALAPDGPQNLLDAVTVAQAAGAHGVVAVCAGVIHGAREVQKVHTYRLDAFSSGDAGPVGYVEAGRLRLARSWPSAHARLQPGDVLQRLAAAPSWPRVEIVLSHAGAGGALVDALVQQGVPGLVVAGTGNGTLHRELEQALLRARAQGVAVVRATRCAQGVVLAKPGDLLPDSQGLSAVKARITLLLGLLLEEAFRPA